MTKDHALKADRADVENDSKRKIAEARLEHLIFASD
jgi:hypothetical protein